MRWIGDAALDRLRADLARPDLEGTRYVFVRTLGSGGMGVVHLVLDPALGREVALKLLAVPDERGDLRDRLLLEARVIARLEHPGIVPVHEVGTLADGRVYYTMKHVEGERLDRHAARTEALPERIRLFLRVAEAVSFAHARSVLHRDLKPENVMVGPFGEVLVLDWGLAKEIGETSARPELTVPEEPSATDRSLGAPQAPRTGQTGTAHGTVLGTPGYMAPEQERGEPLDARADVFALGALLRAIVEREGAPAPPRALRAVCSKATDPDPARRYASAGELAADVRRHLDGDPVLAYREGLLERAGRTLSRHRTAAALVLTYLLLRILLFMRAAG